MALFLLSLFFPISVVNAAPSELVLRHSPVLVARSDQTRKPDDDRYLFLGYSTTGETDGSTHIRYTVYFTDEDSMGSASKTENQMQKYGRRLDIEWMYEVHVDRAGKVVERKYHCPVAIGIGHRTCKFKGKFEEGTEHPLLFNVARHNVFSDHPELPRGSRRGMRTRLVPTIEIPFPESRDLVVVKNPGYLRLSDDELLKEGKLGALSTEYAYIRLRGELTGRVKIRLRGNAPSLGEGNLQNMGLDLWGRESVVGVRLLPAELESLRNGTVPFKFEVLGINRKNTLRLEQVGLYLVTAIAPTVYRTDDLSARIRCGDPKNLSTCEL